MRTTVDLDPTILREAKQRAAAEHKTLGQLISELLAPALRAERESVPDFVWHTTRGEMLIDIDDKQALYDLLDAPDENGIIHG